MRYQGYGTIVGTFADVIFLELQEKNTFLIVLCSLVSVSYVVAQFMDYGYVLLLAFFK